MGGDMSGAQAGNMREELKLKSQISVSRIAMTQFTSSWRSMNNRRLMASPATRGCAG
jgi:hypothetical protein